MIKILFRFAKYLITCTICTAVVFNGIVIIKIKCKHRFDSWLSVLIKAAQKIFQDQRLNQCSNEKGEGGGGGGAM